MIEKWAPLLRAVRLYDGRLPGVKPFREALERAYTQALFNQRAVDGIRDSLRRTMRLRNESLDEGYDAAISLRNFIRGVLGPRAAELRLFGMKPIPTRCRRDQQPAEECNRP
jgi:hypothetical protein